MNRLSAPATPSSQSTALRSHRPSTPRIWINHALQVHLQIHSIMASKCICEFTPSQPPCPSPNSLDYSLQSHLQVHLILASKYISRFTLSQCGETEELCWHPRGICANELFWLEESRKRGWENMYGYPAVRNQTNCVDLWMLGKSRWGQLLGKIDCVQNI